LNGSNGFRIDGVAAFDWSANASSSAGDVNGDGFADILIGAPLADPQGRSGAGACYVVFGKADGFAATLNLAALDGLNGFRLSGPASGANTGYSVSAAGDVNGDGFDDVIVGAPRAIGGAGSSFVVFGRAPDAPVNRRGAAGSQVIQGGAFADTLAGLGGNDVLEGRGGADTLGGGTGIDAASYGHAATGVTADLVDPSGNSGVAQGDRYTSIENLMGSRFADTLAGDAKANRLDGGDGADTLRGRDGNDRLQGGAGNDTLSDGAGIDKLTGGLGADVLRGGGDNDLFIYTDKAESGLVAGSYDTILDFTTGDRIDLTAIDANTTLASNQAFTFIGTATFSGVAGQLRVAANFIAGDVNGDSAADFRIQLAGADTLSVADFRL
jgi:Ca2+-binding RTX toxin-like protein